MKRLIVVRHGKAVPHTVGTDFERPLADRGHADVLWLGQACQSIRVTGDPILSSPSRRTTDTAVGLCKVWSEEPSSIQFIPDAYLASHREWLIWIASCSNDASSCWIIGHNPGLSDLIQKMSGHDLWLPTCGLADIELHIGSWRAIFDNVGSLRDVITPKSNFLS